MAEPGGSGPIGPYPAGVTSPDEEVEYDKLRRRVLWRIPSGLYVVGSRGTDPTARNLMTLSWATQVSFDPKWIGVGIERSAYTHQLVEQSGCFSLSFVDREDRAIVRRFTKPVEVDLAAQTLNGFPYIERTTGAPILAQAVAFLDCEVRERAVAGNHTFFIGEVVDSGFLRDEDTPVLRMEDTRMNYGG
jgi:flavin reductase (DIM6/NTAB) family NADH-FMN oxidoreductase RutF